MPFGFLSKKPSSSRHQRQAEYADDDTIRTPDDEQQNYDAPLGGSSAQHGHDDDGSPEALLDDWLQVDDDSNNNDGCGDVDNKGQENRPRDHLDDPNDDVAWLHRIGEEEHTESTDEETGTSSDDRNMPSSPSWRASQKGDLTEEEREALKNNLLSINADNRLFVLRVQESLSRLPPEERLSMISVIRNQAEQERDAAEAKANKRGRCHCLCNCIVIRAVRRITSRACLAKLMSLVGLGVGAFYILGGETAQDVQNKVVGWFQSIGKDPLVTTGMPSLAPSMMASSLPSWEPTLMPSEMETNMPSFVPSNFPSFAPTTFAPTMAPVSSSPISMPPTLAPVSMSPTLAPITETPTGTSLPATSTTVSNGGGNNKKKNNKGNKKKNKTVDVLINNNVTSTITDEDGNSGSTNIFDPTQSVPLADEQNDNGFNRKLRRRRNESEGTGIIVEI